MDWADDSFENYLPVEEREWWDDGFNFGDLEDTQPVVVDHPVRDDVYFGIGGAFVDPQPGPSIGAQNVWDAIDLAHLFQLNQTGTKTQKKFGITDRIYQVEIQQLPCIFSNETTLRLLPRIFEEIFNLLKKDCKPDDRIKMTLDCQDLDTPLYLTVRRVKDFNAMDLLRKVEMINSGKKLKLDHSFTMHVTHCAIPSGGSKRKYTHDTESRKRFATSLVSIRVSLLLFIIYNLLFIIYYRSEKTFVFRLR